MPAKTTAAGRPRLLLAAYPRSGSTALAVCLAALLGPEAVALHEPFRQQPGPDTRDFFRDIRAVTERADLVKHHPGNLLSRRQNLRLYRRWISTGGTIIHLRRCDLEAQARSLLIARALNSYHRPHVVSAVPRPRLLAEMRDLGEEVEEQSRVLAEVPHQDITYEALFTGTLRSRLQHLDRLLKRIDPAITYERASAAARRRVRKTLDPEQRVSRGDSCGVPVTLVDQVPLFAATTGCLSAREASTLAGQLYGALPETPDTSGPFGIRVGRLADLLPSRPLNELDGRIRSRIETASGIRPAPGAVEALAAMAYDGDRWPDHDLGIFPSLPLSNRPAVNVSITLACAATDTAVGIHVAGHGRLRTRPGDVAYFSGNFGAKREEVAGGSLLCVVGRYPLDPSQILAAGQLLGDCGMFVESGDGDTCEVV